MTAPRGASGTKRRRRRSRGQSLVEFAMILPIFLLILAAILDFGFMLFTRVTLINSTREGARVAVTQGETSADLLAIDENMNSSTCGVGWIRCNIPGLVNGDLTIVTSCVPAPPPAPQAACDFAAGGSRNAAPGDYVRVSTTYAYRSFFTRFFGSTTNLSAQVQVVIE